jgi:hypothetical protein
VTRDLEPGAGPAEKEREADCRRHPRVQVAWPVTVDTGDSLLQLETLNLSLFGAKLGPGSRPLEPGTPARLLFRPPAGSPLDLPAIVWRADPDGLAFFFVSVETQEVTVSTDASESDAPRR